MSKSGYICPGGKEPAKLLPVHFGPSATAVQGIAEQERTHVEWAQKEFPGIMSFCLAAIILLVCSLLMKPQRSVATGTGK